MSFEATLLAAGGAGESSACPCPSRSRSFLREEKTRSGPPVTGTMRACFQRGQIVRNGLRAIIRQAAAAEGMPGTGSVATATIEVHSVQAKWFRAVSLATLHFDTPPDCHPITLNENTLPTDGGQ